VLLQFWRATDERGYASETDSEKKQNLGPRLSKPSKTVARSQGYICYRWADVYVGVVGLFPTAYI
jgi:hypothetical protein